MTTEEKSERPDNHDGLDEAANEYAETHFRREYFKVPKDGMRRAFKAGAEWQKEQMMEDAVEGKVYDFRRIKEIGYSSAKIEFDKIPELDEGDKVRIFIVKED